MTDKKEKIIDPDGINSENPDLDRPVDGEPIPLNQDDDDDIPLPDDEPAEPIKEPTPDEPKKYEEPTKPDKIIVKDEPYMPLPTVI